MSYLLVEWPGEETQFSVVRSDVITDGELRNRPDMLKGKLIMLDWKKNEQYEGRIVKVGSSKSKLEKEANRLVKELYNLRAVDFEPVAKRRRIASDLLEPVAQPKKPKKLKLSKTQLDIMTEVLDSSPINEEDPAPRVVVSNQHYKEKYRNLRTKYKELKSNYNRLLGEKTDLQVELVPESNIYMQRSELETIKLLSKQKTVLARNLFRSLHTKEELRSHSLFGKKCNANKNMQTLPVIDPVRRDVVISFALKEAELEAEAQGALNARDKKRLLKAAKTEICKSLSDFLREESRK